MLLEGKFALKAPIQKVWDILLDPDTLLSCISGAEKIERLDEKTYGCVVKQNVGSISVKFRFTGVLTEVDARSIYNLRARGRTPAKPVTLFK